VARDSSLELRPAVGVQLRDWDRSFVGVTSCFPGRKKGYLLFCFVFEKTVKDQHFAVLLKKNIEAAKQSLESC